MSKEAFITKNLTADRLALLERINAIIVSYQRQGYRLTLRQLYYQLVTKNIVPNTERSYKNVGALVSDGRLIGRIDWEAIEDRVRVPRVPLEFQSVTHLVESSLRWFRLPRWEGQDNYVELWVEKDALAGVLQPLAEEFHITLMVNRGYSSQSAMYESAQRFIEHGDSNCHLLYLGDHDPSGEDMVRDVRDRLELFGATVDVEKIGLTMDQVEEHEPPPNPAKMSDSRAANYVAQHGDSSWEVDALPPNVLAELIREKVGNLVDMEKVDEVKEREEVAKEKLKNAAKRIKI